MYLYMRTYTYIHLNLLLPYYYNLLKLITTGKLLLTFYYLLILTEIHTNWKLTLTEKLFPGTNLYLLLIVCIVYMCSHVLLLNFCYSCLLGSSLLEADTCLELVLTVPAASGSLILTSGSVSVSEVVGFVSESFPVSIGF